MLLPLALALSAALSAEPDPHVVAPAAVEPRPIVTTPALVEPASPWELGTALGGGWASNPLALTVPVGSEFGAARVWLARALGASGADSLWLQLRYDGTRFSTLPDADLDRVEGSLEWGHRFGKPFTLRVVGAGALRVTGDPARSGWDAGARAVGRLRLFTWLALRLGGGYVRREATDPAYSDSTGWLDAGLDFPLWRKASGVARYTLEAGTDWLSATTGTGGGWRGGAGAMDGSRPLSRVAQGGSAGLRQDLWRGLFLQAGYGVSLVTTTGTSPVEHHAVGEVGWNR